MSKTILITGAKGNIGQKLSAHLSSRYELRLLDLRPAPGVVVADLSEYGEGWVRHFEGVDVVVHLAGEMRPTASWAECYKSNVIGTENVLRAAKINKVGSVIYASSNQVMAGYRFREGPVPETASPKPLNPYGLSKLICEELCRSHSQETATTVVSFRIGYIDPGDNLPGPHMAIGLWGQQMWLSNNDAMRAFECAVEANTGSYATLNLVSQNKGMRWTMDAAKSAIGFEPADGHVPRMAPANVAEDEIARRAILVPGGWLDQRFATMDVD